MQSLRDALIFIKAHDYRDGNGSFPITFMKCHRDDKVGGELVELLNACAMGLPPKCKDHEMIGIKCMDTGKKYAVHNRLIFKVNGQEIFWV